MQQMRTESGGKFTVCRQILFIRQHWHLLHVTYSTFITREQHMSCQVWHLDACSRQFSCTPVNHLPAATHLQQDLNPRDFPPISARLSSHLLPRCTWSLSRGNPPTSMSTRQNTFEHDLLALLSHPAHNDASSWWRGETSSGSHITVV